MNSKRIVVCGGGGFIGGHLVAALLRQGHHLIRAVDCKPLHEWFQLFPEVENLQLDLQDLGACRMAVRESVSVFNLAADVGGAAFMEGRDGASLRSVLINAQLLLSARETGVRRYFFASCRSISSPGTARDTGVQPGPEGGDVSAMPRDGHGWEKLYSERLCRSYHDDFGLETRVARYPSVYGPFGGWTGGRERAPAAICRKVIEARRSGDTAIEIWGDGRQMRRWLFVDDCIEATLAVMDSDSADAVPVNGERASINQIVDVVEEVAGVTLERRYNLRAPQGMGRCTLDLPEVRGQPASKSRVSLRDGLARTYRWISDEIECRGRLDSRPMIGIFG